MSAWRQKAIECLPESRKDFINFHKENCIDRLQKIYDFAEWSFRQKSKDLWNAAGVAFYEHLGDFPETRQNMRQ